MTPFQSASIAFGVTLVATPLAARLARRAGWIDRRDGELAVRKPRLAAVPLVGGATLLLGALVGLAFAESGIAGAGVGRAWPAFVAAFLLGAVDDRRRGGLAAGTKLAGQLAVALLLALLLPGGAGPGRALTFLVAVVAMNAANTYDNADGATTGLGIVALFGANPFCAALLGFLPWNLLRVRREAGERVPVSYLGDSGSHLVGVWIASTPQAWIFLALPLLDLGRLAWLRPSRGRAPWRGDRSHLAHRLECGGFGRLSVALVLTALVALPHAGRILGPGALGAALGILATGIGFCAAWALSPDPESRAPCPAPVTGR